MLSGCGGKINHMKKTNVVILLIIVLSFAVSAYFYPLLPDQIVSHWGANGEANGYMSKFWGLFLLPIVMAAMALLFLLIPRIDPLKENIASFRKYFDGFIILIMIFMLFIHSLTIAWNLGYRFDLTAAMVPAMAVLFYFLGVLISKAKRNWFIGIRTPWTLSSDLVWDKTHALGGKLFKVAAFIGLFGLFFGRHAIFFTIIPVIAVAIITIFYSYFIFKKNGGNVVK